MKNYTKTYMTFFGYTIADFMPCEVCGAKAVDIHHITARSIAKEFLNAIENLMALCRKCHVEHGDKKEKRTWLLDIHQSFMQQNGKNKTA